MKLLAIANRLLTFLLLAVVVFVGMLFVNPYFVDLPKPEMTRRMIGKPVHLAGVDFARNKHTLILVLSTHCSHCGANAPFYRAIAEKKKKNNFATVALFLEPINAAQDYMLGRGLRTDVVMQGNFNDLGVVIPGTPTILLVSANGKIEDAWVGELPDNYQREVLRHI